MAVDIQFEIEVECEKCGETLDCEWNERSNTLKVEVCDNCMDERFEEGKDEGREEAEEEMEKNNEN